MAMADPSSSSGENPVSCALRNELVLQEIFNFLPCKSLLTLSEVNKFWNVRARTYIRDHRKCTVSTSLSTTLPCRQLEQLDNDLAGMAIVPFNSLKIELKRHAEPEPVNSSHQQGHGSSNEQNLHQNFNNSGYENVISKLKLKHLWISCDEKVVACPVTSLIFRLLTEAAAELKVLGFKEISPHFVSLFSASDNLEFPRLEELEILDVNEWMDFDNDDDGKSLLQKILDRAPKLKKINHDGHSMILEILPENKFKLLSKFEFDPFEDDEELTRKLVESRPEVSQITVNCIPDWDGDDVPARCNPLFHPLAQVCSSFLVKLEISCASAVQKIRMIPNPLQNLAHLSLRFDPDQPFVFIREFEQVPFRQLFPKLQEVKLDVGKAGIVEDLSQSEVDRELSNFVRDSGSSSLTARKLCVTMEIRSSGLLQLMKIFPYLEYLEISAGPETSHALPYKDIFRFWPNLKTLDTGGYVSFDQTLQNCDADFCGIFQEEAETLREMGLEDLENLQIVPVRPCISTMKNLDTLSVSFLYRGHPHHQDQGNSPSSSFLSAVTKMLVSKRMPWLNFSLNFREVPSHGTPLVCGGAIHNQAPN